MACTDVLRPLDLVPLTDFTYMYHPVVIVVLLRYGLEGQNDIGGISTYSLTPLNGR